MGWYSTGPRLREADLDINDLVSKYCDTPLLVICEVQASLFCTHPAVRYADIHRPIVENALTEVAAGCSRRRWAYRRLLITRKTRYARFAVTALTYFRCLVREAAPFSSKLVGCAGRHAEEPKGLCHCPNVGGRNRGRRNRCEALSLCMSAWLAHKRLCCIA